MQKVILVSLFILFTLLSGGILLVADQAYAGCCMCGTCKKFGCTCRGTTPGCPACTRPVTVSMRDISDPRSAFDVQAITSNDRFTKLALDRQCPQNAYWLRLLEKRETLVLEPAFLQGESADDKIVAFQASADGEK
jgi:hypothetical protein